MKPKYGNKSELVQLVKKEEYAKRKHYWKCSPQIPLSTSSVTWQLKVASKWLFLEWKCMPHRQDFLRTRWKNQVKDDPDRFFICYALMHIPKETELSPAYVQEWK